MLRRQPIVERLGRGDFVARFAEQDRAVVPVAADDHFACDTDDSNALRFCSLVHSYTSQGRTPMPKSPTTPGYRGDSHLFPRHPRAASKPAVRLDVLHLNLRCRPEPERGSQLTWQSLPPLIAGTPTSPAMATGRPLRTTSRHARNVDSRFRSVAPTAPARGTPRVRRSAHVRRVRRRLRTRGAQDYSAGPTVTPAERRREIRPRSPYRPTSRLPGMPPASANRRGPRWSRRRRRPGSH